MRKFLTVSLLLLALGVLVACGDDSAPAQTTTPAQTTVAQETTPVQATTPIDSASEENWISVATLSGNTDQRESAPFALSGGEVKIVANIVAESTGGNGLIYILEEALQLLVMLKVTYA